MKYLFYIRLVGFTAGTLLYLFLLVLLAGLRKPRLFESLLFLSGICLFLFYSGGLLALNVEMYPALPRATMQFALGLMALGLGLLPPLLVHLHVEYARRRAATEYSPAMLAGVGLFYLPVAYYGVVVAPAVMRTASLVPFLPGPGWGSGYAVWLSGALLVAAAAQKRFAGEAPGASQRALHRWLLVSFVAAAAVVLFTYHGWFALSLNFALSQVLPTFVFLLPLFPGSLLGYHVVRQNLPRAGFQRNLVYTVSAGFLALLYLTLARRLSVWLDPPLPPEATFSILLFVLVVFFERFQRRVGDVLQGAFRRESEQFQRLVGEIQQVARAGDLEQLVAFAEGRIRDSFALVGARISLREGPPRPAQASGNVHRFLLRNGPAEAGALEAWFYGESLSGETQAALEFLAEQLPAALDLCRLIEEKLKLERELAGRERLALVGQMAASVSHNLKNPLSSMKTLLQVQLEKPALPPDLRRDCELVVGEIDRLSAKLGQLLRFAKPAVRPAEGEATAPGIDAAAVAEQVVGLLRHDAERRSVRLELAAPGDAAPLRGSEQALSDVLTNLVLNALEAVSAGGAVRVTLERNGGHLLIRITDDGPGIPPESRARVFQPFFTTKPSGTGLGLAIVARRVEELGGSIQCESPVANGRGTRFTVTLPL